jgi:hypothetical protein
MKSSVDNSEMQGHTMNRPSRHLRVGELGLGTWVHAQSALVSRRYQREQDGGEASPWRRRFKRMGGTVVAVAGAALALQSFRATGATSTSLEDLGVMDAVANNQPLVPQQEASALIAPEAIELVKPEELGVSEARIDTDGYDFGLPADVDEAPASQPLGEWDKQSGHGTIWNQTTAYANELGFGDLTERQKWDMTQRVLDENGMTWQEARSLSPNFEPELPTQRDMATWLVQEGAEQTHSADIPVPVPEPGPEQTPPPPTTTPPTPEVVPPVVVPPGEALPPGPVEGKWDMRDTWAALGLAGVLATAYGGQRALDKGKAEQLARKRAEAAADTNADAAETEADVAKAEAEAERARANEAAAAAGGAVVASDPTADDDERRRAAEADARADAAEARADAARADEERAKENNDDKGSLKKLAAAAAVAAAGKWLWEWFKRRATPSSVIRRK